MLGTLPCEDVSLLRVVLQGKVAALCSTLCELSRRSGLFGASFRTTSLANRSKSRKPGARESLSRWLVTHGKNKNKKSFKTAGSSAIRHWQNCAQINTACVTCSGHVFRRQGVGRRPRDVDMTKRDVTFKLVTQEFCKKFFPL